MRILMIVTSCDHLGRTGKKTGLWLEELAAPYHEFKSHGYEIDVASPQGGEAPVDPHSLTSISALFKAYIQDRDLNRKIKNTLPLFTLDRSGSDYDAYFVVGGHGIMYDAPNNVVLQRMLGNAFEHGRIVSAVCHGPAALVNVRLSNGKYLVEGRRINSFTDEEERLMKLDNVVPFLLESRLRERGAIFQKTQPQHACVIIDGNLMTGQNPASAAPLGKSIADALAARAVHA